MRLLFTALAFLISVSVVGQLTYIPDDSFEKLVEYYLPDANNGVENDNYVLTKALQNINVSLIIDNNWPLATEPIFDLTGIEDFVFMEGSLTIRNTFCDEINLSQTLFTDQNVWSPPSVVISSNQYLTSIILPNNLSVFSEISIELNETLQNIEMGDDISFKNFRIDRNISLCKVALQGNVLEGGIYDLMFDPNSSALGISVLESIDLSGLNEIPFGTNVFVPAETSQINLNNDISIYNWNISVPSWMTSCECIEVGSQDDVEFCYSNNSWPQNATYSIDCFDDQFDCNETNIREVDQGKITLIKVVDALGREVNHTTNQILFHIYDDGSVEKKFVVE